MFHRLDDVLSLQAPKHDVHGQYSTQSCMLLSLSIAKSVIDAKSTDPTCVLLPPCKRGTFPQPLVEKIITCLSTTFELSVKEIRPHLRDATLKQYAKVRRHNGGDTMNASAMVPGGDDYRDSTFVHVSLCNPIPVVIS
jgi:hypothetical protein